MDAVLSSRFSVLSESRTVDVMGKQNSVADWLRDRGSQFPVLRKP
jgi:hypothetical protein